MSRTLRTWGRSLSGAAILAALLWRLGSAPFVAAVRTVDARSLVAAAAIAAGTTVCCAWRWRVVARGLGVDLPLEAALRAYYRSQFLNSTLPGGVLGDVHRAVSHGRDVGDVGRGLRAVAWERAAGQAVQLVLLTTVLLALPSPVHGVASVLAATLLVGLLAVVVAAALLGRLVRGSGTSLRGRTLRAAVADLRFGVLATRAWPRIALASALVVVGHVATFLIAARTAGSTAPAVQLVPLALVVLVAAGIPVNIAGWGPREGTAAWIFGAAGLSEADGVTTAVVFGVLALVSSLPGAAVLLVPWLRRDPRAWRRTAPAPAPAPAPVEVRGPAGG